MNSLAIVEPLEHGGGHAGGPGPPSGVTVDAVSASLVTAFAEAVASVRVIVQELENGPGSEKTAALADEAPAPAGHPLPETVAATLPAPSPVMAKVLEKLNRMQSAPVVEPPASEAVAVVLPATPGVELATVRDQLSVVVRRLGHTGPLALVAPEAVLEVRYALVALIDEWFIHGVHWRGRDAWCDSPLEATLFGSRCAGRTLFVRMTALAGGRRGEALRQQLAAVYLVSLKLGFCGEWRGDTARLAAYEETLRQLLASAAGQGRAFPQAYDHCVSRPHGVRVAPLRRYWRWCAVGLVAYLVVSAVTWQWLLAPLLRVLSRGAH